MSDRNVSLVEWIRTIIAVPIEEQKVVDDLKSLKLDDVGGSLELELRGVLLELVRSMLFVELPSLSRLGRSTRIRASAGGTLFKDISIN